MNSLLSLIEALVIYASGKLSEPKENLARSQKGAECHLGWVLDADGLNSINPFQITQNERSRHTYILGATGCGKTNLILKLLAKDIEADRTVVVVDLRGDLIDRVLAYVATGHTPAASEIMLLDLRDQDRIVGFNPLSGRGTPHSRAYLVLDALRALSDSWGVQLEETLRNSLIVLAERDLTLLDLEPLLTNAMFRDGVVSLSEDPSVRAFFERYGELSRERQQSWFLPVLNKVTPLLGTPRLRLLLGAPSGVDFRELLDRPGRLTLIALAVDRLHSAARLVGNLIIGAIEAAVMSRADQPEGQRNPINLYIDEFESMATDAFEAIIAEGRRFGLSLTLSHQNLGQLPKSLGAVIRNNALTQIYFQTGSVDARELRHELRSDEIEDPVTSMKALSVGHAFVCKRAIPPFLVRFDRYEGGTASQSDIQFLVNQIHQSMLSIRADDVFKTAKRSVARNDQAGEVVHNRLPRCLKEKGG